MTTTTETAPADTEVPTLPELIAGQLNSMHWIAERLVKLHATPGKNHVALDISHPFPPCSFMRVLLSLSEPVSFDPAEMVDGAQKGVEIGASSPPVAS